MPHNKEIGNLGEEMASKYLKNQGYNIIERNFRTRVGEIDIVAREEGFLIFVEVKTRRSIRYGYPREAVDINKQSKIKTMASIYIAKNKEYNSNIRFDVVEVIFDDNTGKKAINIIKDAFQ